MAEMKLEHVNLTVADPDATAAMLGEIFGWKVRWRGEAKDNGLSVHVGGADDYLALYRPQGALAAEYNNYGTIGGLNHIGVVVDDIDAVEVRVKAAGMEPYSHDDYEPGRRFYFNDADGIEFEVVEY